MSATATDQTTDTTTDDTSADGDAAASTSQADADAQKVIKELRAEAASRRVENKALADRLKAIEDAKKTSEEKQAEAQAATAQAKADRDAQEAKRWDALRDQAITGQVRGLSSELQIHDADAVMALLPKDLELDDLGVPKNLDAAVRKLVQDKPYLAKTGAGSTANPAREGQTPTAADLEKMTPQQKISHGYAAASTSS